MSLDQIREELAGLKAAGLQRACATLDSPPGPHIQIGGRRYLHLCSNNYLSLATHPEVTEAACRAVRDWGAGSGAARLITGTSRLAVELESALANFKQTQSALLFSSGYLAGLAAVTALAGREAWIISDQLNHASLIDAARLSGATIRVYAHADVKEAERILREAPANARKIILTDGVFSMDGDVAPLSELNRLAVEHDAFLIVDDAHGTGVLGPHGRGACAAFGISGDHIIQILTLSKALGSQGGAVAASREIIELLTNRARSFIFETALAPACVGAAMAALNIVQSDEMRRANLHKNTRLVREGLREIGFEFPELPSAIANAGHAEPAAIPIIPLIIGANEPALRASERLREAGFWLTAIRPPSVEPGRSRLRLTLMADHAPEDLREFLKAASAIRPL